MSSTGDKLDQLSARLRAAHERREPAGCVDLGAHQRILAHVPEDMTVTVETGIPLTALQNALGRHGQWLPLDPADADTLTIHRLLDENLSGPRRFGYGTARDWLIGLKAILADGRVIESGGKVVKNVAGYDLHKLLIGARGELAVMVEATFKVAPRPQSEVIMNTDCDSPARATEVVRAILEAPVNPVVLDLVSTAGGRPRLVVAFAGTFRETDWQREQVAPLASWQPATLDHDAQFHRLLDGRTPLKKSVLPERLAGELARMGDDPWVARAGNGVIYGATASPTASGGAINPLSQRIRQLFDPHGVLRQVN